MDKYIEIQELNAALLNKLVNKIVVHSPEKISRTGVTYATPVPPHFYFTSLCASANWLDSFFFPF